MAQNRNLLQNAVKMLESQGRQLTVVTKKIDDAHQQLRSLQPHNYLHPIPKPRQGKEFHRSTSVAGWLLEEIENLNSIIPEGSRKYLQFPEGIPSRRLNSDCIRELEGLLSFYVPDLVGEVTWEEACNQRPKDCEKVIREAKMSAELAVFAQAAGQWALRMLCANKMRTMITTKTNKKSKRDEADGQECEAPVASGDEAGMEKREHSQAQAMEISEIYQDSTIHQLQQLENEVALTSAPECATNAKRRGLVEREYNGNQEDEMNEHGDADFSDEGGNEGVPEDFCGMQNPDSQHQEEEVAQDHEDHYPETPCLTDEHYTSHQYSETHPAQIQAAAQLAAHEVLSATKAMPYHHERVFETNHQTHVEDFSSGQCEIQNHSGIDQSGTEQRMLSRAFPRAGLTRKTQTAPKKEVQQRQEI